MPGIVPCPNCGRPVPGGSAACDACGAPVTPAVVAPAVAPPVETMADAGTGDAGVADAGVADAEPPASASLRQGDDWLDAAAAADGLASGGILPGAYLAPSSVHRPRADLSSARGLDSASGADPACRAARDAGRVHDDAG
ncbi:MAG: hypothetical protein HW391_1467 [Chloroflexi bacterium]|nr:hypothetical protein [Chloroflexota bacterium]